MSLLVAGTHESEYVDRIRRIGGDSLITGDEIFDEIPKWLAATDVTAIP